VTDVIDEDHLKSLPLQSKPYYQIAFGYGVIMPNYNLPPRTSITIEGLDRIPDNQPVVFALNHTDRYNYFPFQYKLWREGFPRYTSTWVKGKYYENAFLKWFFDHTNNIPLPSIGYLITKDFLDLHNRKPEDAEYRQLRDYVDGDRPLEDIELTDDLAEVVDPSQRTFPGQQPSYRQYIHHRNERLMKLVEERTLETLYEKNNNLIVFPEGTRSVRLGTLRTGLSQFALKHRLPVVPVGSNGSDRVYTGNLPIARGGSIVYRAGDPMTVEEDFADLNPPRDYQPFTREASQYSEIFREATDRIGDRLNNLLDPRHQRETHKQEEGTSPDRLA
jgi:1-acyl-sn-glycerol-3-phosphate acyltransferase